MRFKIGETCVYQNAFSNEIDFDNKEEPAVVLWCNEKSVRFKVLSTGEEKTLPVDGKKHGDSLSAGIKILRKV